jgi:hypothetical protein
MAQSTALRFRNKRNLNPIALLDAIGNVPSTLSRELSDDCAVNDDYIASHVRRIVGDKIETVTDDSSFVGGTSVIVNKTDHPAVRDNSEYISLTSYSEHTVSYPADVQGGDLLLYFLTNPNSTLRENYPVINVSGLTELLPWTELPTQPNTLDGGASRPYDKTVLIAYKKADGSEAGSTFTVNLYSQNQGDILWSNQLVCNVFAISNWDGSVANNPTPILTKSYNLSDFVSSVQVIPTWQPQNALWIPFVSRTIESGLTEIGDVLTPSTVFPDDNIDSKTNVVGHTFQSLQLGKVNRNPTFQMYFDRAVSYDCFVIGISSGVDPQYLPINDSVIVNFGNKRRTLTDYVVGTTDEGFITDKDLLRYRTLNDSCAVTDDFQKTVTVTPSTTFSRVKKESIDVTDNTLATFTGIVVKTLSDAVTVQDVEVIETDKAYFDSLAATDASVELRTVNRVSNENRTGVTDDVIVTRSFLIRERTVSESIATFDQAIATYTEYKLVSAPIITGIEIY